MLAANNPIESHLQQYTITIKMHINLCNCSMSSLHLFSFNGDNTARRNNNETFSSAEIQLNDKHFFFTNKN